MTLIQPTNLKVSLGHLSSRPKQVLVAVLSVTFGISMYIFMNGFMSGVNDTQTELAFSTLAHVRIFNDLPEDRSNILGQERGEKVFVHVRNPRVIQYTQGIRNSEKILHQVRQYPEVVGATPQVNINVFFRNGATKVNGLLSGVDVINEDKLFETSQYMVAGSWAELKHRGDGLVLGEGLAKRLSISLNDNVNLLTSDGVSRNFKVIGLFKTSIASVDDIKAYIRIGTAQQLISKNRSYATDIQVNTKDFNKAQVLSTALTPKVPYKVEAWMDANGQLEAGSELRNIIALAVSLTILLVAGFGIYNIMNMTVNEKIKEIAILKAMGFQGADIIQIFLVQSIIIGVLGGFVGLILGYVVSVIVNHIPFQIASLEYLPMAYNPKDYGLAFIFGLITTFIAGYLPAKKASQIDPVDIIRG